MNGNEFLDKLGNLDPRLVAAAEEAPKARVRSFRPDWASAAVVAVMLALICLPLALTWSIQNGLLPAEPRDFQKKSASHEASSAAFSQETAEDVTEEAGQERAAQSVQAAPREVPAKSEDGSLSWTQYRLEPEYSAQFSEGLPAEEYFKYNNDAGSLTGSGSSTGSSTGSRTGSNSSSENALYSESLQASEALEEVWSIYDYDSLQSNTFSPDNPHQEWLDNLEAQLSQIYGAIHVYFGCHVDEDGSTGPMNVRIRTVLRDWEEDFASWEGDPKDLGGYLSVQLCGGGGTVTAEDMAPAKARSNETVVVREDGTEVSCVGGLHTDRSLLFPYQDLWCRITGGRDVPYEDMVSLMNWILSDGMNLDTLRQVILEEEHIYTSNVLAAISTTPVYLTPYLPEQGSNPLAPPESSFYTVVQNDTATSITVEYDTDHEDKPLKLFSLYTGTDEETKKTVQGDLFYDMGELYSLTETDVLAYYENMKRKKSEETASPYRSFMVMFTWNDYTVAATFDQSLTAGQLWEFISELQKKDITPDYPE